VGKENQDYASTGPGNLNARPHSPLLAPGEGNGRRDQGAKIFLPGRVKGGQEVDLGPSISLAGFEVLVIL